MYCSVALFHPLLLACISISSSVGLGSGIMSLLFDFMSVGRVRVMSQLFVLGLYGALLGLVAGASSPASWAALASSLALSSVFLPHLTLVRQASYSSISAIRLIFGNKAYSGLIVRTKASSSSMSISPYFITAH